MTLPYERTRAVLKTRDFLTRLTTPYGGGLKKIPTEVRQEARNLLRHFPMLHELQAAADKAEYIFGKLSDGDAATEPADMGEHAAG